MALGRRIEAVAVVQGVSTLPTERPGRVCGSGNGFRTGSSCFSHAPGRVVVTPRTGSVARNGASRRASVAGLTWRRGLSRSGETTRSPLRVRRSSNSGRGGASGGDQCGRWPPRAPARRRPPRGRSGRPERGRAGAGPGGRCRSRIAALLWMPATATTSFNSRCFSVRVAHGGVLPQTGSGHGHLLGGVGNRDFDGAPSVR